MIVPDLNLLLYAYDSASPFHTKAAAWWQSSLSGTEPVGIPSVVAFGFVRLATSSRAFERPMTVAEAIGHLRSWFTQPCAQILNPDTGHIEQVLELLEAVGAAGNLTTDAQIAALTIENNAVLHTADTDFMRFKDLRWLNPLTGAGSSKLTG